MYIHFLNFHKILCTVISLPNVHIMLCICVCELSLDEMAKMLIGSAIYSNLTTKFVISVSVIIYEIFDENWTHCLKFEIVVDS